MASRIRRHTAAPTDATQRGQRSSWRVTSTMRVCHVLESAGGGTGQVVVDLVRAGIAAADEVTVIYAPDRAEASFVESLTRIEGVEVVELPMRRGIGAADVVAAWRLRRHLRRLGPFDVVHGHSSKAGALVRLTGIGMRST